MKYYYADEKSQPMGPHTAEEMRKLYQQGALNEESWVIAEGTAEWRSYASLFLTDTAEGLGGSRLTQCPNCGAENGDDALFCETCGMKRGAPLVPANTPASAAPGPKRAVAPPEAKKGFKKHAFISHSSRDHALAERVCEVLESHGLDCWIAPRDIDPGRPYDEEILRGIECSQTFILLLSDASNESPHVKRELMCALRAGHAVYPIRIQEVQPGPKLEYLLEGIHWVDAWTPPIEAHLDRLAQLIANPGTNAAISRHAKRNPFGGPLWRRRRNFAGVALAILALLTAGWVASTWKAGVISGIVSYVVQQVDSRIKGMSNLLSSSSEHAPVSSTEMTEKAKNARHAALLHQAALATSNRQWQASVNAYEAALALFDDEETRAALARALRARDLEQAAAAEAGLAQQRQHALKVVTLSWADEPEVAKRFPASAQILGGDGIAVGELSLEASSPQKDYRGVVYYHALKLSFTNENGDILLYGFREDDAVGQTRVGKASGLIFSACVTEISRFSSGGIKTCTLEVTVYADASGTGGITEAQRKLAQERARKASVKPEVNQTATLSWAADAKVVKRYPSSDQILNAAGEVIGEVSLNWGNFYPLWEKVLKLTFTGLPPEKKETLLCEFRSDDPVGQTRFGKAEGFFFSGKVTEVKGESTRNGELENMTIQVTATCDAQNYSLPRAGAFVPAAGEHVRALEAARQESAGMAGQPQKAAFNDLMQRGQEAEERKDWQGAKAIYLEALGVAPDAKAAAQVRTCGGRVMALLSEQAQPTPSRSTRP